LSEEKKLSIAALSQTLPERLIEQVTPLAGLNVARLLRGHRCEPPIRAVFLGGDTRVVRSEPSLPMLQSLTNMQSMT